MERYVVSTQFEHKFWKHQPSEAASHFGGEAETKYISYHYSNIDQFNLDLLEELIDFINNKLNSNITLQTTDYSLLEKLIPKEPDLKEMYLNKTSYSEWLEIVQDLADIQLGLKIYHTILRDGYCKFDAEL